MGLKFESRIKAGKTDGSPVALMGQGIDFIRVPAGMTGSVLNFKACFENGAEWFWLLDEGGKPVTHSTTWAPHPIPEQEAVELVKTPVFIPVPQWKDYLRGVQFLIPVSNQKEKEDVVISFYQEKGII